MKTQGIESLMLIHEFQAYTRPAPQHEDTTYGVAGAETLHSRAWVPSGLDYTAEPLRGHENKLKE